jgi:DNA-binding transcriptional regulator LsrR (DeoR family)
MVLVEGWTFHEVSVYLQCTESTVRRIVAHAQLNKIVPVEPPCSNFVLTNWRASPT